LAGTPLHGASDFKAKLGQADQAFLNWWKAPVISGQRPEKQKRKARAK
jgi:hypothetical protein